MNAIKQDYSTAKTLKYIIEELIKLVKSPCPSNPLNLKASEDYFKNRVEFDQRALKWTQQHAISSGKTNKKVTKKEVCIDDGPDD